MNNYFDLQGGNLTIDAIVDVAQNKKKVRLAPEAKQKIKFCRQKLEQLIVSNKPFYGINTGFGALAGKIIPSSKLQRLQLNLIRSHAAGVGQFFSDEIVRAIMLLRANVLALGHSGVRPELVELLISMLNAGIIPLIPEKGSVGASGDLAPLAHLALALIGEGQVKFQNKIMNASTALKKAGLQPVKLVEKEGLALINGTQAMTAIGVLTIDRVEWLLKIADLAAVLTFEAQLGNPSPFDRRIHQLRPYQGQKEVAENFRILLEKSQLQKKHQGKMKVQDAYSLRCTPQVHGAIRETVRFIRNILLTEINSATENPLIFPQEEEILSGGNFHGEPVALALDFLAIALCELGNISERRIDRLVNPASNMGLPAFLIKNNGLNSGFMIAHVTASALASENKVLAHPASADSIPTSANQEDHVSMGTIAARKAADVYKNSATILSIEVLTALQALDFYQERLSPSLEAFRQAVREQIPFLKSDQLMYKAIVKMQEILETQFNKNSELLKKLH